MAFAPELLAKLRAAWAPSTPLRDFLLQHFDAAWYLRTNADVAAARTDPLRHWLQYGVWEGRKPAPDLELWRRPEPPAAHGWHTFEHKQGFVALRVEPAPAIPAWVQEKFDAAWYLRKYPDVAAAGADPLWHWLDDGLKGGRVGGPGLAMDEAPLLAGEPPAKDLLAANGTYYRQRPTMAQDIVYQVLEQGRLDPSAIAPGARTLALLPQSRQAGRLNYVRLFETLPRQISFLFAVRALDVGGAEKYAADMVQALLESGQTDIAVIVTEQTSAQAEKYRNLGSVAPLWRIRRVFWQDLCAGPARVADATLFARAINALRPRRFITVNSHAGTRAIATCGQALSTVSRLYCAYFVVPNDQPGLFLEGRYSRMTVRYSKSLTDNRPLADFLADCHGPLGGPGVAVIPNRLEQATDEVFERRLTARKALCEPAPHKRLWLWISRINNSHKGAGAVASLARQLPSDEFHLFGPLEESLDSLGLNLPNVFHRGVLQSVLDADFTPYHGFLLTSGFEGLPNIVLEMTQHALPLVLARVGGLTETFSDHGVEFVDPANSPAERIAGFCRALNRVAAYSQDEVERRARKARAEVAARHDKAVFRRNIARFLDLP